VSLPLDSTFFLTPELIEPSADMPPSKQELVDDLALARVVIEVVSGIMYFEAHHLFDVRMYASL